MSDKEITMSQRKLAMYRHFTPLYLRRRALSEDGPELKAVMEEKGVEAFPVKNKYETEVLRGVLSGEYDTVWDMRYAKSEFQRKYVATSSAGSNIELGHNVGPDFLLNAVNRLIKIGILTSDGLVRNGFGGGQSREIRLSDEWA